jgi:hypothetical protein
MFDHPSPRLSGAVVNYDALLIAPVTRFFYDASPLKWSAQGAENLRFPLPSFTAAMAMGLTRSFLFAHLVVNVLFAMLVALAAVNLAERFQLRRDVTLAGLLVFFSLPMYVDYLGQPMHYVVGISVSFLAVMSVVAVDDPRLAILAIAIIALNYDPYVFLAALVLAFAKRLKWSLLLAAIPAVAWALVLRVLSGNTMTTHLQKWFVLPVLSGWVDFLMRPDEALLFPFVATHIGWVVAFHEIVAMVYWPLLAVCVYLLFTLRPKLDERFRPLAFLLVFYVLEQLVSAAYDWELNPRRAIPVVLAFAFAYFYVMHQSWERWRPVFLGLCLMSGFLAMTDFVFLKPAMAYLRTGQAIRHDLHNVSNSVWMRLDTDAMPHLQEDGPIDWFDTGRAKPQHLGAFAVTQAGALLLLVSLFWLTAKAGLLPRWLPYAAAGVWVVSLVRFL